MILGVALACPAVFGASGDRPIQNFGYPGSGEIRTHWAAARTESGRIIASGNGLVELRGGKWAQLTTEGGFDWQSLLADGDGRVWAGATNEIGVFEPDAGGTMRYRSLTSLLPEEAHEPGDIWGIHATGSGAVFVGKSWVVKTDGKSATSWFVPVERRLFSWIDGGLVCIGDEDGNVFRIAEGGPEPVSSSAPETNPGLMWSENFEGTDWIAISDKGLASAASAGTEAFAPLNKLLRRIAMVSAQRIDDGRLAVATYYGGLLLIDTRTGEFEQIAQPEGLSSSSVVGILHSGNGWLWVATTRGIDRVATAGAVTRIRNDSDVDGVVLRAVDRVGDSVVISTDSGRYALRLDGAQREITKLSPWWFLSQAKLGGQVIGGTMGGLYAVVDGKTKQMVPETEDVNTVVVPANSGDLVIYSTKSAIRAARRVDGRFVVVAKHPMDAQTTSMAEGIDGDIWFAAGNSVERISLAASGDRFVLRSVHAIRDGGRIPAPKARLFAVGGSILALRDGVLLGIDPSSGEFRPIPAFRDVEFADVVSTAEHGAWALARPIRAYADSPRLVRLHAGAAGQITAEAVDAPGVLSMGMLRNIHLADLEEGGFEIWIGATDGILRVDPERLTTAPGPPALTVQMARTVEGSSNTVMDSVSEFHSTENSFSFGWSAPYMIPGDLVVETRIVGAEEKWTPAGDRTTREFTGLGEGSYVFEARAVDALGRPGPVASRAFTVLPPWYRTPWAVSGFCVAVLSVGWIAWLMRIRVARRRAEELEELVDTRTRELARVNAEMTRFIARMNHEIRNPLNGLLGAVGVLEQFKHAGREGRMIQILRACADHLGAVVEDVLDFSNIEGGRIVVQDRAFPVAEMLEAVPRMMLAESERTGTEVVTTIAPDVPPVVVADPDRIRQILVNFLGNALKFAPGEPVHVEVTTTSVDESPCLRFAVRDHGPGISEADKKSLFLMFERGKNPAKSKVRGMGIGLATCRLLARRMGGEVGVISGLGEGSEFFLRLPLRVEAGVAPAPEAEPQVDLHGLACLIVEDQEFNRVILSDMLKRLGCTVDEAADAETALKLAAMNRYDVVFTDLALPDAAPGEILKMLKEQQAASHTPVPALVVTTAYATENVRQTCLGAGATAFLAKPLAASKVLAVLREIDSARRPAASMATPEPAHASAERVIFHLARIRGCDVASMAAEIAGNIDEEVRRLRAGATTANSREVAHRAHRLLSLSALADYPELAGVAAGIQNEARDGRVPAANRLEALVAAAAGAGAKLASITSAAAPGAQSRAQGRSESTASSHSD